MDDLDLHQLKTLRHKARERRKVPHAPPEEARTWSERAADVIAATVGSWGFVTLQSLLLLSWIIWNAVASAPVDPYPFILLNLLLSFQAAYTAPIIMMSQNRQADVDRTRSILDYEVNQKAEMEIELLHTKIDLLREQEIARLAAAVDRLTAMLDAERKR